MSAVVCHVVHNTFTNDSRVLKEVATLSAIGISPQLVLATAGAGLPEQECLGEGVQLRRLRLPRPPSWARNKATGFLGILVWAWRCQREIQREGARVVHCHDLDPLIAGFLAKAARGVKVVYDAHEFETETKSLHGLKKTITKVLERLLIHCADAVVTVSPSIAANYRHLYGVQPELVLNCPPAQTPVPSRLFHQMYGIPDHVPVYLYQGGLVAGRGIELILEAFALLPPDEGHVVVMGYGPLAPLVEAAAARYPHLHAHPAVPPSDVFRHACAADVGICLTDTSCRNHLFCLPNKFFEYLQAGLPVVSTDLYELRVRLAGTGAGVVIEHETPEALLAALREVRHGLEARKATARELGAGFTWEKQEPVLRDIYHRLLTCNA